MNRIFLIPVLGFSALAVSSTAHAQAGRWLADRTSYSTERQSYYDARRVAYDNGYREGARQGERDGRRNDAFNYQDDRTFRRGDNGYHREYGDFERYRQTFRSGYAAGYSEAYQRHARSYGHGGVYGNRRPDPRGQVIYPDRGGYSRYPQSYPGQYGRYSTAALQNGLNDGYEKGVEDARKNRSFDPLRHSWYRSGDRHYERHYGPKEQYKDLYRDGFKDGYARGYREGRYR